MLMRFPNGKTKTLTFSYDDANVADKRLCEIFTSRGLKATFNINSANFEKPDGYHLTWSDAEKYYLGGGHEVAVHTYTHPWLDALKNNEALNEIIEDRRAIEKNLGVIARGMAYPFGCYNDEIVEAMRLAGIVYSRTTIATEGFFMPKDWLRLETTCHHNNEKLFDLAERFLGNFQQWGKCDMLYVWGHSYEFDRDNNWDRAEKMADMLCERDDIWYATNIEIYDYVKSYESLCTSFDNTIVYNPSAIEVWFEKDGKLYSVKGGQRIKVD